MAKRSQGYLELHETVKLTLRGITVWAYTKRENIPIIPLYFANERGERYRSLGCAPCTSPIKSRAATVAEVIAELEAVKLSERCGRLIDFDQAGSMERKKQEGYF